MAKVFTICLHHQDVSDSSRRARQVALTNERPDTLSLGCVSVAALHESILSSAAEVCWKTLRMKMQF